MSNPQLLEIIYKVNEEFDEETNLRLEYLSETIVKKSDSEREAEVTFILNIFKEKDFNKVPFVIKMSMKGDFRWMAEFDDKVDNLLKINAPATLLSYLRPFVAQFTSFSGFPPLIMPLFDFTDTDKKDNVE